MDKEKLLIIEDLQPKTNYKNRLDELPISRIKIIMSDYNKDDSWKNIALPELRQITEENNVQFNLNCDIGRLVLCDYPNKLVVSSPLDPNNTSGNVNTFQGLLTKEKEIIIERIEIAKKAILSKKVYDLLGVYGQLNFTTQENSTFAEQQIKYFLENLLPNIDGVVTSGSLTGVGEIGHRLSSLMNLKTIGIIPSTIEHQINKSDFDLLLIEGEDWGDGSFLFGGLADKILFIGGGCWSYLEYKYAKYFNKKIKLINYPHVRYSAEFKNDKQTKGDFCNNIKEAVDYFNK